ncbi:MAG TPA: histidine phosphatase family protein [Acidimicrobiales bacterium]|nr:histidine phosphatase family protein [Acidimicrobiales bacterium]
MLILVRHGRTDANRAGLLLGRLDVALDATGERQAAAVAAALGTPDRVVSSPLGRARATAAAFGRPVEVDDRWVELDYGDLDGTPLRDVPAARWGSWREDPAWRPPGGESLAELGVRVRGACADLVEEARERDVVVVSHVSPIKAAAAWAMGVGDEVSWRLFLSPASITRVGIGPHGPSLHGFNDVAHLAAVDPADTVER